MSVLRSVEPQGFRKGAVDAYHKAGGIDAADEVQPEFGRKARYFNAFGGNAVAAEAVLEVIGNVPEAGLFLGVEIVSDRAGKTADGKKAARVVNNLREVRALVSGRRANARILKIRLRWRSPPRTRISLPTVWTRFCPLGADDMAEKQDKRVIGPIVLGVRHAPSHRKMRFPRDAPKLRHCPSVRPDRASGGLELRLLSARPKR